MTAIDFIQYSERMVGENSPDYSDTLNRALKTVVSVSGADEDAFVGFALRPVCRADRRPVLPRDRYGRRRQLANADDGDDFRSDQRVDRDHESRHGEYGRLARDVDRDDLHRRQAEDRDRNANRLTIGGTATDPTFDIAATYVGQTSIVTLGTVTTGVWNGTSIGTGFTDAKVVSISGTSIGYRSPEPRPFP
jgi:hypothetical protein